MLTERHIEVARAAAGRLLGRVGSIPAVDFDDLTQEGLMAIWARTVEQGRAPDPPLAWWIAREAAVALLRRSRPRGRPEAVVATLDDSKDSVPRADAEPCLPLDMRDAVGRLTPALRAAALHRLDGLGPKEAAAAEWLTVKAMDSRRDRAFAALRTSLAAYYQMED